MCTPLASFDFIKGILNQFNSIFPLPSLTSQIKILFLPICFNIGNDTGIADIIAVIPLFTMLIGIILSYLS